ncbi:hypothetical protein GYA37_01440 [candidate division WWE3 bacterium]|uniref:Polysaccharide biosynthesis protein C-terminal domain-containing protein n=1 Tax=candidate division WWE3 bacterium TaxID=2053526 RepID=A0A7X9E6V6_UNCKA|nr:hypothetical protein [candidate division WWE3 bacterium]
MNKSIQKIVLVGIGNIFNAVLGFAFISAAAKTLDLDSFGKYALLATLLVATSKLIDFGTNSVYVAKSISTEDKSLLNTFYTLKIILLLISIPISVGVLLLFKFNDLKIILYFVLGLAAYSINYTLNPIFQKEEKFFNLVLLNTFPALIKGTFAILMFTKSINPSLTQTFEVFSLSILSSTLMITFLPRKYKQFKFSALQTLNLLKESYPAGISQLIYEGWPSIANSIAKIAKDFSSVGIFSIAEKVTNILTLASVSVFTVLLPKNAYRKKQHMEYDFKEILSISTLIIVMAFIGTFASEIFISRFLGEKFSQSIPLLGLLIFASAFTSIHTFMEHYFFIEEKTKYIMYISLGKLIVFLILSIVLTPILSLQGIAISNLVGALIALFSTMILIWKHQGKKKAILTQP